MKSLGILGPYGRPAEVHFPDLSLIGPRITIDQPENVAEVQGAGSMRLLTQTDLSGNKLSKPTELTVLWKQSMVGLLESGFASAVEFGPGKVLAGLNKRIAQQLGN